MATDREKEREAELESAMYTNCLLLGLDPAVLGVGVGGSRVGHFRHSNPRLGEQLLYFLLSALRGPVQSAKDFDKVWPIFDSTQSREFRKIVQGIISELEAHGALPRSSSRVSSLATCCGPRFVELLWQLSVHALREVHKRTFTADVTSNPLPASLTDASYLNAAALLPVTKARIALERRKFLGNANIAVHRQAAWSDLAHEMTAEFRSLCAEEAYLQQELEKLQDMRNKAKLEGELWDDRISSSGQNHHLVSKATRLWESLLARQNQHEVLASGPIEDLIAHREHRYRISGSSLLAAMDLSSNLPHSDVLSVRDSEMSSELDTREKKDLYQVQRQSDALPRMDDRGGRVHPTVDVAEVLRRWTHALQRIHKQSLNLVKANDGEGPDILRSASDGSSIGHSESLAATLAEHRQHLVSIQGLIDQLKETIPTMQQSISELTEEVNNISTPDGFSAQSTTAIQRESIGRPLESITDEVADITSKLSSTQLEKFSNSSTLKLPHLFNLTPNSSAKGTQATRRRPVTTPVNQEVPIQKVATTKHSNDTDGETQESADKYAQNIRRSVREAALSSLSSKLVSQDGGNFDASEHFFISLPTSDFATNQRKQQPTFLSPESQTAQLNTIQDMLNKTNGQKEFTNNSCLFDASIDDTLNQVFSPPLLLESSFFQDAYEDLLAPLSETDAALMDH
ncbi:AUGMIN subunit 6-like isoform X1 [Zingiber officinale]|uniref:AUGMIN subunit 6-like isoform X1 n=1 Tax=Zingiber officinale TaxID=94328 RepID=UPI001C4DC758|nr:AUGMIN subunit 6-like isoform X1 [Zingiber officinale]